MRKIFTLIVIHNNNTNCSQLLYKAHLKESNNNKNKVTNNANTNQSEACVDGRDKLNTVKSLVQTKYLVNEHASSSFHDHDSIDDVSTIQHVFTSADRDGSYQGRLATQKK